ncbi:MAG: TatD family hydrolase [Verrucomicrobiota bacterium]
MSSSSTVPLFDAHNHLQDGWLAPHRAQVLRDLARIPLRAAVVNGTCETDWPEVTSLCHPAAPLAAAGCRLLPSYGLHPWYVGNATPQWRDTLLRTLDAPSTTPSAGDRAFVPFALGEIGLDRWILDRARPDDPRLTGLRRASLEEQREAFTWQLALAAERNLPVTIHCLEAWGALAEILRTTPLPARGFLLHAYGGSADLARELIPLGAYFSFNGSFLNDRQCARREVFKTLPLDRLLAETDAPAMPLPASHRTHHLPDLPNGTALNHPANIDAVYAGLAQLRALPIEVLAATLGENFTRLFGAPQ